MRPMSGRATAITLAVAATTLLAGTLAAATPRPAAAVPTAPDQSCADRRTAVATAADLTVRADPRTAPTLSAQPTDPPPTDLPPTDLPPTDLPPTGPEPTDLPPTGPEPTDLPPTCAPTAPGPTGDPTLDPTLEPTLEPTGSLPGPTGDPTLEPTGTLPGPTGDPTLEPTGTSSAPPVPTGTTIVPSPTGTVPAEQPCEPPPVPVGGPSPELDALHRVATRMLADIEAGAYPGFAGISLDRDRGRLLLCWLRGDPLPPSIAAIAADPGEPVAVVRQDAAYARADLAARVPSIFAPVREDEIGAAIHTVVVPEEGTGLIVGALPDEPSPGFRAAAEAALSAAAGVPVTVEVGPVPEDTSRYADTSPYYAGARIVSCSDAFGVTDRAGAQYLLTANHCNPRGAVVSIGRAGAARRFGVVTATNAELDAELIKLDAPGRAGSSTYVGGVNDNTETAVRSGVRGTNVAGLDVCDSGSYTGELCGLTTSRVMKFIRVGGRLRGRLVPVEGPMMSAAARPGRIAVAKGNSGGPVILRTTDGAVESMGVVSAGGGGSFGCALYDARVCFGELIYVDIKPVLDAFGVTLA